MRKALVTSLALAAVAALVVAVSASGRSTAPSAAAAIPGCAKDKLGLLDEKTRDLIVAAALRTVFASVNAALSSAAGWFRVAYSAVFLVAIAQLAIAVTQLDTPDAALASITAFTTIWHVSLIIFAGHLLLVGYLAFRSGFVPRVFGILLLIAGAGYLVDGFMSVLVAQPPFTLAAVTFVGEVALIFWLLIAGGRGRSAAIA